MKPVSSPSIKPVSFELNHLRMLADTLTPVSLYLKLRDQFANTVLLESSDYHGNDNSYSYLAFESLAEFRVEGDVIFQQLPGKVETHTTLGPVPDLAHQLGVFLKTFDVPNLDLPFLHVGVFGYQTYDTVRYYEEVEIQGSSTPEREIPEVMYRLYRYLLVVDHFKNELHLLELLGAGEGSNLARIKSLIANQNVPAFQFERTGEERTNIEDDAFLEILQKGKDHCQRGDVFQIVLSRQYQQQFLGDEFNVYRCLRSINPSPYLFYCDYGRFKIFGSSPEAQLIIQGGKATIHPIAGTFRRTCNDESDKELAQALFDDPKENSEHIMLVDLARNDLSRNGQSVKVETFKEIQFYSHVIHLVSKVTGELSPEADPMKVVGDTFPAGTLSGAPKHMAMQLIDRYENQNRGFYGGAIGAIGLDGSFNHAIMIRSFMSKNNTLYYQAGAGVVARSVPEKELQEVHNKLGALRKAMEVAETL
ncbi:MAG: anthranilate synthase component I family protein [Bacteroidota bacterium]